MNIIAGFMYASGNIPVRPHICNIAGRINVTIFRNIQMALN